jgi:hypothetical protein
MTRESEGAAGRRRLDANTTIKVVYYYTDQAPWT